MDNMTVYAKWEGGSGPVTPTYPEGDLTKDGVVNALDLAMALYNYSEGDENLAKVLNNYGTTSTT